MKNATREVVITYVNTYGMATNIVAEVGFLREVLLLKHLQ